MKNLLRLNVFSPMKRDRFVRIPSPTYRDEITGMEFIYVPGGIFEMGDVFGDGCEDELPVHEVELDSFYLGKFPVTQKEWQTIMNGNPSYFQNGSRKPVEQVRWDGALRFIQRLNALSGRHYQLPTEAQWEFAARGGGKLAKWSGTNNEQELEQYAWFQSNSGWETHPVGEKKPNSLGLYDMSGNLSEWVYDVYSPNFYQHSSKTNPFGPHSGRSGSTRVIRGGSYASTPGDIRTVHRHWEFPAWYSAFVGLRLALPLYQSIK